MAMTETSELEALHQSGDSADRDRADGTLAPVDPPSRAKDTALNEPWVVEFRKGDVLVRPLGEVRNVSISAEDLAAGDDVLVVVDLFARGVTDVDRDEKTEARMKRELRKLAVRVESELIKNGSVTLHDGGASGDDDHDALLYWSLSSPENKTGRRSESGTYPLKLLVGKRSLGSLKLKWLNER